MRKLGAIGALLACALLSMGAVKIKTAPLQWKPRQGWVLNADSPYVRGLIAAWLMTEGGSANFNSLVSNPTMRFTPSAAGGPSWGPSHWGVGVTQIGVEMQVANNAALQDLPLSAGGFTVLMWIRNPGNSTLLRKTAVGTNNAPGWQWLNAGAGQWIYRIKTSATQVTGTTNTVFPTSSDWYQVVWTYNGANVLTASNYTIYMNGQPVTFSTNTNGTGTYNTDSANPLAWPTGNSNLDHILIWNRALSAGEIRDLYAQPFAFMTPTINPGVESLAQGSAAIRHRVRIY